MKVNTDISDLFFNTDHDGALTFDRENLFSGYDRGKLEEEARLFLGALQRLGAQVPTIELLVDDFLGRV